MIETIVLDYLKEKFNIPVSMEEINEPEYILIEKTGAREVNHIKGATLAIQCYSTSLYKAASLNEEVKTAMVGDGVSDYGICSTEKVSSCSLNSDYNYTDTTTKNYRYQAVFNVTYY